MSVPRPLAAIVACSLVLTACGGDDEVDDDSPIDVIEDDESLATTDDDPVEEPDDDPDADDPVTDDTADEPAGDADGDDADGSRNEQAIDLELEDASFVDEDYVSRVMTALDGVLVDVVTDVQESDGWTDSAQVALEAIYTPDAQAAYIAGWQEIIELGFVADPPSAGESRATEVISASPTCIAAVVERHTGDFFTEDSPFPTDPTYLVGLHQDPTLAGGASPTVWEIHTESIITDEDPTDVCAAGADDVAP